MTPAFIRGRLRSVSYACVGIAHLVRTQRNAWVHLAATLLVIASGWRLHVTRTDWCWLILAMAAVWVADAACPQWHPLVGRAKDVAAGAVLLAACGAAGIGVFVLGPRLF